MKRHSCRPLGGESMGLGAAPKGCTESSICLVSPAPLGGRLLFPFLESDAELYVFRQPAPTGPQGGHSRPCHLLRPEPSWDAAVPCTAHLCPSPTKGW